MPITQIGPYQIRRELGRGSSGTVYHAFDPTLQREVAVIMLPVVLRHHPKLLAWVERELPAVAWLRHPSIVRMFDFGEHEAQPYIVMEYMLGGTLAERLTNGPLPVEETLRILRETASALDFAHAQGILHRSLSTGNILFDRGGRACVTDFWIARMVEALLFFSEGVPVRSPACMSPEQIRADPHIDARSDIYSLGVIVFEMLAGHPPYTADSALGVMQKHLNNPVPEIRALRPELPPEIEPVIQRAMAKDPADRFPTAGDLCRAVEGIFEEA